MQWVATIYLNSYMFILCCSEGRFSKLPFANGRMLNMMEMGMQWFCGSVRIACEIGSSAKKNLCNASSLSFYRVHPQVGFAIGVYYGKIWICRVVFISFIVFCILSCLYIHIFCFILMILTFDHLLFGLWA